MVAENRPKELDTLGDYIRGRRIDFGLFQSRVAKLIGVHPLTITNWERNESQPTVRYIPAIIRFLACNPLETGNSFSKRLLAARRAQGLTQRQMADRLSVAPSTLRDWESGLSRPSRKKQEVISEVLR